MEQWSKSKIDPQKIPTECFPRNCVYIDTRSVISHFAKSVQFKRIV